MPLGLLHAQAGAAPGDMWSPDAYLRRQTHGAITVQVLGEGMQRVYIFLPSKPALSAGPAPMVFFHHGWQGMNPKNFGALLDHLAREGNVVIFPVYQENDSTSPQLVTRAASAAERNALLWLQERKIIPAAGRVVYFGYSMGAAISLQLAVTARQEELPPPAALVLAAPGDAYHVARGAESRSTWPDLIRLPKTLPVAIVTGADDRAIGLPSARKLAAGICHILPDRRVLMVLPSDVHGEKHVNAGHASPGAPDTRFDWPLHTPASAVPMELPGRENFEPSASLNQLDFWGYWKVLDALLDSLQQSAAAGSVYVPPSVVFRKEDPAQSFLGTWPDGTAYPAAKTEDLCSGR